MMIIIIMIIFLSPSCILKRTGWRMSLQVVAMWERFHLAFYLTSESKWPCIGINHYKDQFSANGWKDQKMDFSFSSQRKPLFWESIVRLASRVAVWRESEVSIDF